MATGPPSPVGTLNTCLFPSGTYHCVVYSVSSTPLRATSHTPNRLLPLTAAVMPGASSWNSGAAPVGRKGYRPDGEAVGEAVAREALEAHG